MQVYVQLLGEGTQVWRPVSAEPIAPDIFRLSATHADRDIEVLEFLPGQLVRCSEKSFSGGETGLTAVEQAERDRIKQPFLARYDYGQGAIWIIIRAESGESIRRKYPELAIAPRIPEWMTPELMCRLQDRESYDVDSEPSAWLAKLVEERTGA